MQSKALLNYAGERKRGISRFLEYFLDKGTWIDVLGWRGIASGITIIGFGIIAGVEMKKTIPTAIGVEITKAIGLYLWLRWRIRDNG